MRRAEGRVVRGVEKLGRTEEQLATRVVGLCGGDTEDVFGIDAEVVLRRGVEGVFVRDTVVVFGGCAEG